MGYPAALERSEREWRNVQKELARALRTLRVEPTVAPVLAALKRFGKGAPLERCHALADLFDPRSTKARAVADMFVEAGLAALEAHPLGQIPLAHGTRDAVPSLVIAQSGMARITLSACDPEALAALPSATTVRFQQAESWMRVLAGAAEAERIVRRVRSDGEAVLHSALQQLESDNIVHRHGPQEALHLRRVEGLFVFLRLERHLVGGGPLHECRLPDGALVHRAVSTKRESRDELIVALLGAMGRTDAIAAMIDLAEHEEAGGSVRWQAMQEVAVLDRQAGLSLIERIVNSPDDPLAEPSRVLRDSLLGQDARRTGCG